MASPLSVLYMEEYESDEALAAQLQKESEAIQCVVGRKESMKSWPVDLSVVSFGESQFPNLTDYADGVNTLAFLAKHMG